MFQAKKPNAPVHIYIHGGAWRQRKASEYAYMAELFVRAGAHCVIPDFVGVENCKGDLLTIADQVMRAIAWVGQNAASFGGDPRRIYISGQSSGAQLGGVAVTTDWTAHGLPRDVIKGALAYKTLLIWPYAVAPAIAAVLWLFMFQPSLGMLARPLRGMGIDWNPLLNANDAMILVVMASVASGILVRRRLDRLDLVQVLKTNLARRAPRVRVFEVGRVYLRDPAAADGPLAVAGELREPRRAGVPVGDAVGGAAIVEARAGRKAHRGKHHAVAAQPARQLILAPAAP